MHIAFVALPLVARHEQLQLIAELRNREGAHQETLVHMNKVVEELRTFRCSEAELLEEAYIDAISQDGEKKLETESWESRSTVNQLTHQGSP